MVSPVLDEIAEETGSKLIKIDVDANPELAKEFSISGIPAIMVYNNGVRTKSIVGAKPKPALKKVLFD
jgi:thioredoxin 1